MAAGPPEEAPEEAQDWASEELGGVAFKDARLPKRLAKVVLAMFHNPLASIKAACRGAAEVMGAYRLFHNEKAPAEEIVAVHRRRSLLRAQGQGRVLAIQDTSEADYTRKKKLEGTGPLSDMGRRGLFLDIGYLLGGDGLPLGLWRVNIYRREEEGFGRSRQEHKKKPIEQKESFRWLQGYRESCALAGELPGKQVVYVADREGDIYEIYEQAEQFERAGRARANWAVRMCQDRACGAGRAAGAGAGARNVGGALGRAPELGTVTFRVKSKTNFRKNKAGSRVAVPRKGREVTMSVRAAKVRLRPPQRPGGKKLPPVEVWAVRAAEVDPPEGEEPLEWTIFTDLPCESFEAAIEVLEIYARRWEIEVFFRVLKTGCQIEEVQLKAREALEKAICCYMVVAWRILYLTKLGRTCPDLPCESVFETGEWQAVWAVAHGRASLAQLGHRVPTLGELLPLVAGFGGYLNRKGDGPPGAQAMWEGMRAVYHFTLAWEAFGKEAGGPAPPG